MEDYYNNNLNKGLEYQDFLSLILLKYGIVLNNYSSKKYQLEKGENLIGVEIKFDDKHKTTGNLFIEIAEKTKADNQNFVASGIYRNDRTWLYIIGNYEIVYIFSKKRLQELHKENRYKTFEIRQGTAKGFLLPQNDIKKFVEKIIKL